MEYLTMPNFGLNDATTKEDSSKFSETTESNAIEQKSEGGYSITRPRFKQRRRRIFSTAFTNLTEDQKNELQAFEESMGGTISPFYYRHPQTNELHLVQFKEPLKFTYKGMGPTRRWDVDSIKLREV